MRKILLVFLFLLLVCCVPSYALIQTDNTDIKEGGFGYKVAYKWASYDVGSNLTAVELPVSFDTTTRYNLYYPMIFKGNIVGVSIAASGAPTAGSATAEVYINGLATGVRTAIDAGGTVKSAKSGGRTVHTTYNYNQLDFDSEVAGSWGGSWDGKVYPYGRATALAAGDYIGVKLTTSSNFAPNTDDFVVTVIILQ